MAQIPHARESERECTRAQMLRQGTDRLESQSMRENALGRKCCAKELIDWKVNQWEQDWAYFLAEEISLWEPKVGKGLHWKPVESS